jgi:GNAT superfamily N-acetyltransferase
MNIELYFLRSSEQKIAQDMVEFAHPKETTDLEIYTKNYGLTTKDLGLYALIDNEIAGAIWCRELNNNRETPVLSVAVPPKYKGKGVGSFMMNQFLIEAAAIYEQIIIDISHKPKSIKFYEKFDFKKKEDSKELLMLKKLEKKEIIRPTDGYDSSYWMD